MNDGHDSMLLQSVIKLAYEKPALRDALLPVISRHTATQKLAEDGGEPDEAKAAPGGKPAASGQMIEFIKEKGDERVKNPDTGNQVKIKSLGGGPKSKKLQKDLFKKWLDSKKDTPKPKKKAPKEDDSKGKTKKKKEDSPSKKDKSTSPGKAKSYSFGVTEKDVTRVRKEYAKTLTSIKDSLGKATRESSLNSYKDPAATRYTVKEGSKAQDLLKSLSDDELRFHEVGESIGKAVFAAWSEKQPKVAKAFETFFSGTSNSSWVSDSDSRESYEIRGALEKLGIASGVDKSKLDKGQSSHFDYGKDDPQPEMLEAIKEAYALTQAVFSDLGMDEVTVFRGIKAQADGLSEGDEVELSTMGLSSWSSNPQVAEEFGSVMAAKIPVSRIFGGFITSPAFGGSKSGSRYGESELMVLGGDPIDSKLAYKP
jgi:hypothetical protein